MMRRLLLILFVLSVMPAAMHAAQPDARKIKSEQQSAKKTIERNNRKLESNKKEISKQMGRLNELDTEIGARDYEIGRLEADVNNINNGITNANRSITQLTAELAALRTSYTKALRKVQAVHTPKSTLAYLLSAKSIADAMRRLRYVREFAAWRSAREREIAAKAQALGVKNAELKQLQLQHQSTLSKLNENKALLATRRTETDRLVAQLQKEGGTLQAEIEKKQQRLTQLDKELNRIIESDRRNREAQQKKKAAAEEAKRKAAEEAKRKAAEEAKRKVSEPKKEQPKAAPEKAASPSPAPAPSQPSVADADRKLTGDFESNRGRLLFPVSGSYRVVRGFGKTQYSARVQTSHVGVDIQVPSGAKARAVFEGVVTNVSRLDGFNTIVVVRHGVYLTVYINLASATVKAGQKVVAGQVLGAVAADDADPSHGVLQFGLRKERTELNPLQWVK